MATSVLVTGGTGFLGAFIIDSMLEQHPEWMITVLDLVSPEKARRNVEYEIGDVTDKPTVSAIIQRVKPRVIVHTAGIVPDLAERYGRRLEAKVFKVNVEGTRTLLTAARTHGVEAFVSTGSCCAVTDDMTREYANIDETVSTSAQSLIYGESKVR